MNFTLKNTERITEVLRDVDAEKLLLSACCKNPDALAEAMEAGITPEWFAIPLHQRIWEVVLKLDVTGSTTLDLDVGLHFTEERVEVMDVLFTNETGARWKPYLAKVTDAYRRRQILTIGRKLQDAAQSDEFESSDQILELADGDLTALTIEDQSTLATGAEIVERTWENLLSRQKSGGIFGVPSGLGRLDAMTQGWQPGQLITLAARTGVGKTSFSVELALAALKKNHRTLYFSLEMTSEQVMERMLANVSEVPTVQVTDNTISKEQDEELASARRFLSQAPLVMDDSGSITVAGIRAKARKEARRGLDLIVVDYAQIVKPENARDPREQQVGKIAHGIKMLAKELRVPIILLAQLNRDAADNRMPRITELRESDKLAQDSDLVIALWKKDEDPLKYKVSILKQRQGRCGTIDVQFRTSIQKFTPAPVLS